MYPNSPSEWWSSQIRHSSYDMPRVASTFGSTLSGRSIFAIRSSFLCPVVFRGRRVLSHGFGYAASDAMVHYEPPAMSRQYEQGRSSIMLGVADCEGHHYGPTYYMVRLRLGGTTLRAPPIESQPDRSYTVRPAGAAGTVICKRQRLP